MKIKKYYKKIVTKIFSVLVMFVLVFGSMPAPAPAYAALYSPGETLNPACLPTDPNCGVAPSLTTNNANSVNFGPTATTTGGTADLRFLELAANGSNYVGLKAPDVLTANVLYTLPNADGANGQVLSSNGTGALSWITPATTGGLTSLNGLTTSTQTFAVGTTGTDFGITSSGSAHTFNLPTASGTSRGLLASADWTTFNGKVSSQWTTSGNNIYYNTGNVGIGTNTPTANLSFGATAATINNAATNGALTISSNGTGNLTLVPGASGIVQIGNNNNQSVFIGSGSLQINTSPQIISLGQILPGASIIREGLRFLEPAYINGVSTTGNNYVGLQSPGVDLATTTVWSLPVADGTSGQVLSTDGASALSWATSSGASSLAVPTGSNVNGGSIASNVLTLSLADGTNPGLVSTGVQTLAGAKTFSGAGSFTGVGTGLAVTNNTTVGGTLGVTGATTLSSTLGVTGNQTNTANLTVNGSTSLASLTTSGNVGIGTSNPSAGLEITPASSMATQWTLRSGADAGGNRSVAYGNGIFVSVPDTNVVFTSTDGITWTQRSIPTASIWRGITYANGIFVAVGSVSGTGTVMTSPDGITWTNRTAATGNGWRSVTYGNNLFVAVADSGTNDRVMTSPDGITWTSRTSASNDWWYSVTYGNNLFVAVSYLGSTFSVMTSPDGITWTGRTATNSPWHSVAYGGGIFVAVSESGIGSVITSPDGITWTDRTPASNNNWKAVTYGNGLFVAVSFSGTGNRVMTSPDGITWTSRTSAADNNWQGVTFGNNLFVAVANSGTTRVMTSSGALPAALVANGSMTVGGNIAPTSNAAYDLGSATNRFRSLYLSGTTLYIGDQSLSNSSGSLTWSGASIQATPSATSSTDIKLSELSGNGSNYTGFKSPDSLAANVLYTLPNADATASGQVLSSNATGALSWITPASGSSAGGTGAIQFASGTSFAADAANLFWDDTNNRLGIGTATPATKLAVAGGDVSVMSSPPSFSATGGTITTSGGYTIHTFTGSGTFTVTGNGTVDILAVAGGGGGGGGTSNAGGAGAGSGGVVYAASQTVATGAITVTVGTGGAGGAANTNGTNGGNSAFGTTIATGGGGGGSNNNNGSNGGSGGGGGFSKAGGAGTAGQGNNGGNGAGSTFGGGGGAGGNGGNAGSNGGNGGPGVSNSISGAATTYAGGGAGGVYDFPASCTDVYNGTGGAGGGGNVCVAGTANTGGGSGGAGVANSTGPSGGSGIVIVRYLTPTSTGGNVGIGTTAPLQLLHVVRSTDGVVARFTDANGDCDINPTSSALICSSDERLKKNIITIDSTLEKMLALNPVTFNWNKESDGEEKHLGFIAQDVEKLFPSLVSTNENGFKAVAYGNFTPLIIKSIQEQQLEIAGFAGSKVLTFADANNIGANENPITNPVSYIADKINAGIKIAKDLVAERVVAVNGYFKRIFANELCLTDSNGELVCVTGDDLRNIGGQIPAAQLILPQDPIVLPEEDINPVVELEGLLEKNEEEEKNPASQEPIVDNDALKPAEPEIAPVAVSTPISGESMPETVVEPTPVEDITVKEDSAIIEQIPQ